MKCGSVIIRRRMGLVCASSYKCLRVCEFGALGTRRRGVSVRVSGPNNGSDLSRPGGG